MPPNPPFPCPIKNSIFIFTTGVMNDYFNDDLNRCANPEFLLDYIKYNSNKGYICASIHEKICDQVASGESSLQYINSLICNGADITGKASFGAEKDDIIFLAGMLSLTESPPPEHIIIVTEKGCNVIFNEPSSDVITKLSQNGITQFEIKQIEIKSLVDFVKAFDKDFMEHVKSLYSGTV